MDFETLSVRLAADYLGPVLVGGLAALCYLVLLARAQLRIRTLLALHREAGLRRARQEELRRRDGYAPRLHVYERLEEALKRLLEREGLRPAADPVRPAPLPPRVVRR